MIALMESEGVDADMTVDLSNEIDSISHVLETESSEISNERKNPDDPADSDVDSDVLMTIRAGAGGVEAEDWCKMLARMYSRWAASHRFKIDVYNTSKGSGDGLNDVSMRISGSGVYRLLRHENGVHRLMRISPFDKKHRRQTSFCSVEVIPFSMSDDGKNDEIIIDPKDYHYDVYNASGPGGQGVNTTYSAVRLVYTPLNIVVTMQNERSQIQNRRLAMNVLKARLREMKKAEARQKTYDLIGDRLVSFGGQARTYSLEPYKLVKDHRSGFSSTSVDKILDGDLDKMLSADIEVLG